MAAITGGYHRRHAAYGHLRLVLPGQVRGLGFAGYCAEQLHLSANYFGDLVKKETGQSAKDYIQLKLLALAKERIFDPSQSVSEVAFSLGFKYPQHFSRVFKQLVGCTPSEYRALN